MPVKPTPKASETKTTKATTVSDSLETQSNLETLNSDLGLMFQYAIDSGKELPTNLLSNEEDSAILIANYNALQKVIQPVTVESIKYLNTEKLKRGSNSSWYNIPTYTKCVVIAAIALVLLIGISLSPTVNETNQASGLLESSGVTLLFNLIFICAASLLGVMFYLLKTFGDKIKNYTLVASDAIELNASIIIGVISGFVISELFAFTMKDFGGSDYVEIHKMTLALLGGFSSDAIFSILQGLVNKFKGLITT